MHAHSHLLQDIWQCLELLLVVTVCKRVEGARDAARRSSMWRVTAPQRLIPPKPSIAPASGNLGLEGGRQTMHAYINEYTGLFQTVSALEAADLR